ncbi:hypothetical protein [Microbacterium sp. zg.Y909]|uniref:hypothetical protein n=1 Tax=Microbacterium sp. zg.Y909 TaxID=2969413 RepID=UPI00214BDA6D|nr:hypothetical protein [Microbacterium sp. zg.Y909]MCR2824947.1 hypothetical protein [Microbacterium sp. zg.Y909]
MAKAVEDVATRSKLALYICVVGVVGITAVSIVLLVCSDNESRPEMARLIFAAVLPLFGTWIGTVLAFYFAKENLQAASDTTLKTLEMSGTFTQETKVKDVMTPLALISPLRRVPDKAAAGSVALRGLYQAMKDSKNSRVPIITNGDIVLMVVHEPDIDKFAQLEGVKSAELADSETIATLRGNEDLKRAVDTFSAVGEGATLGEAREAMNRVPGSKDVFVTSNGKSSGKILGWLTNSDLARMS